MNIRRSDDDDYVITTYQGSMTLAVVEEIIRETAIRGEEWGLTRFLVDLRQARHGVRTADDYRLAYERATSLGMRPGNRYVLLTNREDARQWAFVETVFRNAGFSIEICTDEAQALVAVTR